MSVPLTRETPGDYHRTTSSLPQSSGKVQPCEPCRTAGYKCNRQSPCSSCVLRGKKRDCYAGSASFIPPPSFSSSSGMSLTPVEPPYADDMLQAGLSTESDVEDAAESARGRVLGKPMGRSGAEGEGLYAGATSFLAQLKFGTDMPQPSIHLLAESQRPEYVAERDQQLEKVLPSREVLDGLIDFYFERCTWIFKYIDRISFTTRWQQYKSGAATDPMALAGAAIISCIAVYYLPPNHTLARTLDLYHFDHAMPGTIHVNAARLDRADILATGWYKAFFEAPQSSNSGRRISTMDEFEVHLARTHFLGMSKIDAEEMWAVRGTLVSAALAMGLHRDPGEGVPLVIAERRRWIWWHLVFLERWQAFIHGRPLAFSPDHYDTALPKNLSETAMLKRVYPRGPTVDIQPATDDVGKRTYETSIAHFRLCEALGKITRDALSQRAVPYSQLRAHDAELERLLDSTPARSFPLWQIANCLKSTVMGPCRQGVQALVLRMAIHYLRFTLHRPYASGRPKKVSPVSFAVPQGSNSSDRAEAEEDAEQHTTSLARAIAASRDLIELASVASGSIALRDEWSLYAHLNWAPIQIYSAALFLIFAAAMSSPPAASTNVSPVDRRSSLSRPSGFAAQYTGLSASNTQRVPSPQVISATSSQSSNSTRPYAPLDAEKLLPVIHRAIAALKSMSFLISAAKAVEQLEQLGPLYSPAYLRSTAAERFEMKMDVFRRSGLVPIATPAAGDGGTMGVLGGETGSVGHTPASQATPGDTPSHYEPVTPSSDGTWGQDETPMEDTGSYSSTPQPEMMDVEPLFLPSPQSSATASMHSLFSASPSPAPTIDHGEPHGVGPVTTSDTGAGPQTGGVEQAAQSSNEPTVAHLPASLNHGSASVPDNTQVSEASRVMYGPGIVRRCWNCHTTEEKTWRTSLFDATKTVCNACGLHERTYGYSRGWPADSSSSSQQQPGTVSHSQNLVSSSLSEARPATRSPAGVRPVNWKKDYSNAFTHGVPAPTSAITEQELPPATTPSRSQTEHQGPVAYYTRPPNIPYDPTDWRSASRIPAFSAHPEAGPSSSLPQQNSAEGVSPSSASPNPQPRERSYSEMLAASSDWSRQHAEWYQPVEPQIEPIISPQAMNVADPLNPDAMQPEGGLQGGLPPQAPIEDFAQAAGASQSQLQPGFTSVTAPLPGPQDPLLGNWWQDFTADESWAFLQSVGLDPDVDMLGTGGLPFDNGAGAAGTSQQGGGM